MGHLRAFRTGVIPYPGVQYCEESGEFSQFFKEIITLKIQPRRDYPHIFFVPRGICGHFILEMHRSIFDVVTEFQANAPRNKKDIDIITTENLSGGKL